MVMSMTRIATMAKKSDCTLPAVTYNLTVSTDTPGDRLSSPTRIGKRKARFSSFN
jgi:hypothetical protein